ncbi:MAG: flagellar biosynthesis protein FlhB [Hyphomicrobiales bacterium]|nr:flagellar biosynthesis protein FlhB [Hyphomicrobiales bacterium]MCP5373591.1 flagellar biosynthesis protein FlhB [Hyphomicrobiales bacterium]
MAEQDDSQKTEEPTPKKRQKAREQGEVARSTEVNNWVLLAGGTAALMFMIPGMMSDLFGLGRSVMANLHQVTLDGGGMRVLLDTALATMAGVLGPFFLLMVVLALAAGIGQIGLIWAPSRLKPKFERFDPVKGLKRKFSLNNLVEFTKGIIKLCLVSVVAFGLAIPMMSDIAIVPMLELPQVLDRLHDISLVIAAATVMVMTVIAALDFMYQRYTQYKNLRMTKQEVKDEHKQAEGDPHVKARIRRLRQERAQQRMMAAVPQADVVITNPTHYAVALEYKMETMPAPRVVAKGVDSLAQRIRETAEEHDVPLVENPPLARGLYAAVELDEEIPAEYYQAVAEVIGYVMRLKGRLPN